MKKSLFFILLLSIIFIFSSCLPLEDLFGDDTTDVDFTEDEYQNVKLIYTAYNEGAAYSLEELEERALTNAGANNVMSLYSFFKGEITLEQHLTKAMGDRLSPTDIRIRNYIGNVINHSNYGTDDETDYQNNWLINYFDNKIPVDNNDTPPSINFNPVLVSKNHLKVLELQPKIYEILDHYMKDGNNFDRWYDFYATSQNIDSTTYPAILDSTETITETIKNQYSEYLARIAVTYTESNISFTQNSFNSNPWVYGQNIDFDDIPPELLLAVLFQESNFVPFSYRAEVSGSNIYGLSFGLAHILIDADKINISSSHTDIGDGNFGDRDFSIISHIYFGNDDKYEAENVFRSWDLLTVRGSTMYALTYLSLIYNKIMALK
ncbi:MAG: hypothetical protein ACQESN_05270 [Thermotogota bacterium]